MLKVGITGIGFMGMIHYLAYQRIEGVKVTALCESFFKERLAGDWTKIKGNFGPQGTMMDLSGIATYENLDEMLKNPELDVIDICLPPNQHAAATIAALNAGKHVFCEKPIALRPEEGVKMVDAAKKNGKMLMIGHVLPFYDSYGFVAQAAQSGKYGKLLGGHFNRVISDPVWLTHFYDMNKIGGPLLDLHVHDAHFIRAVFGMPKAVQSVGRSRGAVPEYFSTQFIYDNPGLVVTANSGCIMQQGRPFMHNFEAHFEEATVAFDSFSGLPVTVLTKDGGVEKPEFGDSDDITPFVRELTEAQKAFTTGVPSSLLDGVLARDALILCHKEVESILWRKRVEI
ncbi:MAG: Gfo/Idh/MocA family oxidoreductase [Thermoguttaceae bacterium]|nr:Gfo/Idh/MocA family oxidoreductase [Thermoguttaceae bacterium]